MKFIAFKFKPHVGKWSCNSLIQFNLERAVHSTQANSSHHRQGGRQRCSHHVCVLYEALRTRVGHLCPSDQTFSSSGKIARVRCSLELGMLLGGGRDKSCSCFPSYVKEYPFHLPVAHHLLSLSHHKRKAHFTGDHVIVPLRGSSLLGICSISSKDGRRESPIAK